MKPVHYSARENPVNRAASFCFRSDRWNPADPRTCEATGPYDEMRALADRLNAELIEREWRGQTFTRYITNWYVTVDADEAARLGAIDHTPSEQLRITPGVQVRHNRNFAVWSDRQITNAIHDAPQYTGLPEPVANLIYELRGSDSGGVYLEGGLERLLDISEMTEWRLIAAGNNRSVFAQTRALWCEVVYADGQRQTVYACREKYFEGYAFDLYADLNQALARLGNTIGPASLTDFDHTRFDYSPDDGYRQIAV